MDTEDLDTQNPSEAADLAIKLLKRARADPLVCALKPSEQAYATIRLLPPSHASLVRLALHSLACYLDTGVSTQAWLHTCQHRAIMGHTFRAVFHWQYKATRGLTPRITNRGGQGLSRSPTYAERATLDDGEQRQSTDTKSDRRDRLDQRDTTERLLRLRDLDR